MTNWTTACTKCLWITCWFWKAVQLWVSLSWKALICSKKLVLKRRIISTLLSGVLWNSPVPFPALLRIWALQDSGSEQFQEHVLRCGKSTSPKQKKPGETFPGGMNTQCRNPVSSGSLQGVQTNPFSLQLCDDSTKPCWKWKVQFWKSSRLWKSGIFSIFSVFWWL